MSKHQEVSGLLLASCGTYRRDGTVWMLHGHTGGKFSCCFPMGSSSTGLIFLSRWSLCMCA